MWQNDALERETNKEERKGDFGKRTASSGLYTLDKKWLSFQLSIYLVKMVVETYSCPHCQVGR